MGILVYDEILVREPRLMVPNGPAFGITRLTAAAAVPNALYFPFYTGKTDSDSLGLRSLTWTNAFEHTVYAGRKCIKIPSGTYATLGGTFAYNFDSSTVICSAFIGGTTGSAWFMGSNVERFGGVYQTDLYRSGGTFGGGTATMGLNKWSVYCLHPNYSGRYGSINGRLVGTSPPYGNARTADPFYINAYGALGIGNRDWYVEWLAYLPASFSAAAGTDMTLDFNAYRIPA